MRHPPILPPDIRAAYLDRLGLDAERPSAAALIRLHRAHAERVPYETFWLQLGQPWNVDRVASATRIARDRRGGYCFHLNGALAALLSDLGYRVALHVAGVHERTDGPGDVMGNHVALTVTGLPDAANPEGRWYLDVGLGDVLHEPVPLEGGAGRQGAIAAVAGPAGEPRWHFLPAATGSIAGVTIASAETTIATFAARHAWNVGSPGSAFHGAVTAQVRHAAGSDVIRGCVLTRRIGDDATVTTFTERGAWLDALGDLFDLHLDAHGAALADLWRRVQETHQTWLDTRGPEIATDAA